jgi:sulfonate dioxygenase
MSATETATAPFTLIVHPSQNDAHGLPGQPTPKERGQGPFESYPYNNLLPKIFPKVGEVGPPLEDFEHVDPGLRALKHDNPWAFLGKATKITNITPVIGTDVEGVNLAKLTNDERDQLALAVARRHVMVREVALCGSHTKHIAQVFRNQDDFFNAGGEFWKEFGSYYGQCSRELKKGLS